VIEIKHRFPVGTRIFTIELLNSTDRQVLVRPAPLREGAHPIGRAGDSLSAPRRRSAGAVSINNIGDVIMFLTCPAASTKQPFLWLGAVGRLRSP
jgi:hypothetical protein